MSDGDVWRATSRVAWCLLGASTISGIPTAGAQVPPVDTLIVSRTSRVAGGASCIWARGTRGDVDKGALTLLVRSTQDDNKTAEPFGSEVVVVMDGVRATAPEASDTERALVGKGEQWAGKQVAVVALKGGALLCSAQVPPLKAETKPTPSSGTSFPLVKNFTLLSGAEFSSADGFGSRQLRVPVTADWFVPIKHLTIGTDAGKRAKVDVGFLSLTARAEATSLVRAITRTECSRITQTGATTSIPPSLGTGPCGDARVDTLAPGTYRVTQYVRRTDAVGPDTMPSTGLVWRATADVRLERRISESNRSFLGAIASLGIETNPNVPSTRSIARRSRFGASLRHLNSEGEGCSR